MYTEPRVPPTLRFGGWWMVVGHGCRARLRPNHLDTAGGTPQCPISSPGRGFRWGSRGQSHVNRSFPGIDARKGARARSRGVWIGSSEKGLVQRPFLVNGLGFSPTARISQESWHFLEVHELPSALESETSYRRIGCHAGVGGRKSLCALKRLGGSG